MFFNFEFYNTDQLSLIIQKSARQLSLNIEKEAIYEIACRSRGTPRLANRLLRRVRDYAQVKNTPLVDRQVVKEALDSLNIDEAGLDEFDRRYLKVLIEVYKGGPAGVEAISASLNESADTIMDVIEPYLLQIGFIKRGSRGRLATEKAYKHLNIFLQ